MNMIRNKSEMSVDMTISSYGPDQNQSSHGYLTGMPCVGMELSEPLGISIPSLAFMLTIWLFCVSYGQLCHVLNLIRDNVETMNIIRMAGVCP